MLLTYDPPLQPWDKLANSVGEVFILFVFFLLFVLESSDWPGTHYVGEICLKTHEDPPVPTSSAGISGVCHHAQHLFKNRILCKVMDL